MRLALAAAGKVSAAQWQSCLSMRKQLFCFWEDNRALMSESTLREAARTMARVHFETTAMHTMGQRDRDEQLLLMGDVIGRLFSSKDENEFKELLAREWHW